METIDSKIRDWLRTFPGWWEGSTPAEVLEKAHTASGVQCSVGEFAESLSRYGFRPDIVRGRVRLTLPTLPVNASRR